MNESGSTSSTDIKESENVSEIVDPLGKKPRPSEIDFSIPEIQQTTTDDKARFFKTKICYKFSELGCCRKGKECSYAHGQAELRPRPGSAQAEICRLFLENKCHYGYGCRYIHWNPELGYNRENSAITIQTTSFSEDKGSGHGNSKSVTEKSLCKEREKTRRCSHGERCPFAHGQAELEKPDRQLASTPRSKPTNTLPMVKIGSSTIHKQQDKDSKSLSRSKTVKQLSGIYGDWPEDYLAHRT